MNSLPKLHLRASSEFEANWLRAKPQWQYFGYEGFDDTSDFGP